MLQHDDARSGYTYPSMLYHFTARHRRLLLRLRLLAPKHLPKFAWHLRRALCCGPRFAGPTDFRLFVLKQAIITVTTTARQPVYFTAQNRERQNSKLHEWRQQPFPSMSRECGSSFPKVSYARAMRHIPCNMYGLLSARFI